MFNKNGEKTNPLNGSDPQWKKNSELQKEEASLRNIVDRNFEKSSQLNKKPRDDLVDNFHWVIMRARREKKITQEQFAKEISEPVIAIKLAEQGILPQKDYVLLRKIENSLRINLVKEGVVIPEQKEEPKKELSFGQGKSKTLTIADLKNMKKTGDFEYPDGEEG